MFIDGSSFTVTVGPLFVIGPWGVSFLPEILCGDDVCVEGSLYQVSSLSCGPVGRFRYSGNFFDLMILFLVRVPPLPPDFSSISFSYSSSFYCVFSHRSHHVHSTQCVCCDVVAATEYSLHSESRVVPGGSVSRGSTLCDSRLVDERFS